MKVNGEAMPYPLRKKPIEGALFGTITYRHIFISRNSQFFNFLKHPEKVGTVRIRTTKERL